MNGYLTWLDLAPINHLIILLLGALLLLLFEAFFEKTAKKWSLHLTLIFIALASVAAYFASPSNNRILNAWLQFDTVAHFCTLFFLAIGFVSTLLAASFFRVFDNDPNRAQSHGEYFFLLISSIIGLILIGAAADFLTLFLGLETLSVSLYILCGYMKKWEFSQEAALKYFLFGAVASAFFLYGIALIYGAVGTTNFADLIERYHAVTQSSQQTLFLGGVALITLGLAFKAAIVPFHLWAPDVYDGAPTPVTAFMAVGTKVGAFVAFFRVFLIVLPGFNPFWNQAIAWLAIITLIYANSVALRQTQLRRFFAYSGISHAGFLLIPLIANTADAWQALAFYLVVYSLATFGSFAVLATLDQGSQGVCLPHLQGLFYRNPFLATIFALCLLTLAGIPPTVGFFAKFYLFKLSFQAGYYVLTIVGLLTAIISAFYYVRIISLMFSEKPQEVIPLPHSLPAALVGVASFAGIVIFSISPDSLIAWLNAAAY